MKSLGVQKTSAFNYTYWGSGGGGGEEKVATGWGVAATTNFKNFTISINLEGSTKRVTLREGTLRGPQKCWYGILTCVTTSVHYNF